MIIQLADLDGRNDEAWKTVQVAQQEIGDMLPHVKSVISRDVCESHDIHPPTKDALSKRVAAALMM